MRTALPIVLLLAAGCTSLPDVRCDAANGVVWAHDAATAAETSRLWDDAALRLAALDAGLRVHPVEVWVVADTDDDSIYGGYDVTSGRILLDAQRQHPSVTLAHELVHAYEPPEWDRLPAVVREGLADWLASRAVPEDADEMFASRAISLASYAVGGLPLPLHGDEAVQMARIGVPVRTDLTPTAALRIPHGQIRGAADGQGLKALYGMGLLVVTRAGLDALTELSVEAAAAGPDLVPPERILRAARLDADAATWLPAIEGLIASPERQSVVWRILGLAASPDSEPDAPPAGVRD